MNAFLALDFLVYEPPFFESMKASGVQFSRLHDEKMNSFLSSKNDLDTFLQIINVKKLLFSGRREESYELFVPKGVIGYDRNASILYLRFIYVNLHQQRQGIGTQMIHHLQNYEHPDVMEGWAEPTSLGFWRKKGFSLTDEYKDTLQKVIWCR